MQLLLVLTRGMLHGLSGAEGPRVYILPGNTTVENQQNEHLCVCVCESMHDGVLPSCRILRLDSSRYFRSPSSPWMVFLMRNNRVVCH